MRLVTVPLPDAVPPPMKVVVFLPERGFTPLTMSVTIASWSLSRSLVQHLDRVAVDIEGVLDVRVHRVRAGLVLNSFS